ncbi:MAG: aminoacyl-tRNA hydrolase [Lachnospiraceae bacterium]|nr:aminoacyl-tRNA hydrolase [Lachnospiraceae bacterium]
MFVIAGLGNPEKKYDNTRHNIGYEVINALSDAYGIDVGSSKFNSLIGTGVIGGKKVMLMKPLTYMNLSGDAIAAALSYYREDACENLLVICDDVNLPVGKLRIREKGSAGGHNGLKNIIARTGTEGFKRLRIGVGEKPKGYDLADWVLGHYDAEDRKTMDEAVERAVKAIEQIVGGDIPGAMNNFN